MVQPVRYGDVIQLRTSLVAGSADGSGTMSKWYLVLRSGNGKEDDSESESGNRLELQSFPAGTISTRNFDQCVPILS